MITELKREKSSCSQKISLIKLQLTLLYSVITKIHARWIPYLLSVNKRESVLKMQRNHQNHFQNIPKRLLII